jgi:GNAT superfamily N-acetyltransferase
MLARRIEEASLNAWPARQQLLYDGWIVRLADGYTKRANSVTPLYSSELGVEEKITHCEGIYRARGLPPIFRLTSLAGPPGLDEALERRGYRVVDPTLVLHLDLTAGALPSPRDPLRHASLGEWLPVHTCLNGARPENEAKHAEILRAIAFPTLYARIDGAGGEPVACGLGVLEGDLVGLFDLVTDSAHRRHGHGMALVLGMLRWARGEGAWHAYLQVVEDNEPARRMYARLGFRESYRYRYRVS